MVQLTLSTLNLQAAAGGATAARLTVGFNMARMREAAGDLQAARKEYEVGFTSGLTHHGESRISQPQLSVWHGFLQLTTLGFT